MHFLQLSTHFSKTRCRPFAATFRRRLGDPFPWLERPRNHMVRDLDCMAETDRRVDWWNPIRTSAIHSRSRPMRFLVFSNHEKGVPRQEISKQSFKKDDKMPFAVCPMLRLQIHVIFRVNCHAVWQCFLCPTWKIIVYTERDALMTNVKHTQLHNMTSFLSEQLIGIAKRAATHATFGRHLIWNYGTRHIVLTDFCGSSHSTLM
jgi:hypothetical protein